MEKQIFNKQLLEAYYISQKHGQEYRKGRTGVILLLISMIVLPCAYLFILPRFISIKEHAIFYIIGLFVLLIVLFYLLHAYMQVRDKKMLKSIGISVDKIFPDQNDYDEYQEEKVNLFHAYLTENNLLTDETDKDLPLVNRYIECLERERKHWYTNPKFYTGAIFGVLFIQFWHVFLGTVADVSEPESKITNMLYCLILLCGLTLVGTFVMVGHEAYIKFTHKKSKDYKNTIRYLNILKDNLIYETAFRRENEEDEKEDPGNTREEEAPSWVDYVMGFVRKFL